MSDAPELQPATNKPIVLIGPMGVGKTTVGKKLAKVLKRQFIDTDALIVAEHGDISEIFATWGEPTFRKFEEAAVATALETNAVIATGGGAVLSELSQERLRAASVIYLSSDGRHMGSRLASGGRPLIKNGIEDWRRIYDQRRSTYEAVADVEIMVSGLSLSATVAKIRELLGV